MRTQLMAAAAVAALASMGGAVQAQTTGHVGASYGRVELDAGALGEAEADAVQLDGSVRFDADPIGAQLDASMTRFDGAGSDATLWSGTLHLNGKVGNGLIGGFGGVSTSDDVTLWAVGVEGQANLAASTSLYGQVGYGQVDDLGDVDFWAGRAELRHFFADNFKVKGIAGFTKADAAGADLDAWNLGAEAEYQFAGGWSVLGGYEHGEIDDVDLSADTFRIGLRYTFGGTLKERDQSGAAMGSVTNLFGGSVGQVITGVAGAVLP